MCLPLLPSGPARGGERSGYLCAEGGVNPGTLASEFSLSCFSSRGHSVLSLPTRRVVPVSMSNVLTCSWAHPPPLPLSVLCAASTQASTVMFVAGGSQASSRREWKPRIGGEKPLSFDVKSRSFLRIVWAPIKPTGHACHSTRSPNDHPRLTPQRNVSDTNPDSLPTLLIWLQMETAVCLNKPSR